MIFRTLILCAISLLCAFDADADDIIFPTTTIEIQTRSAVIPLTVEVATSTAQQMRGLMYRKNLPDSHGMIFIFDTPRHIEMWMKNTLIPLDMIFIGNDGTITQIVHDATPESTDIIASGSDARSVLEIAGGAAVRNRIAVGDKVLYTHSPSLTSPATIH